MICLCIVIVRDGMKELSKFGLMFGLLCGINFIFYAMPVLGAIVVGKTEQRVEPIDSGDYGSRHDTHRLSYTLTVKTLPFIDFSKGFMYNAQSIGELLMPIAMLLGAYLGITAHYEFTQQLTELLGEGDEEDIGVGEAAAALLTAPPGATPADYGAIIAASTGGAQPPAEITRKTTAHKAFSGASHKLAP
jgi:hypothetical protein